MANRTVTPRGTWADDFEGVVRVFANQIRRIGGGGAVCVYLDGETVVDAWAGKRDPSGLDWEADTMAMSFSTTKGVTATALHVLADGGLVDYDAPVARYWPEFAANGKGAITVRHALSHRAGLYGLRRIIEHGEDMLDWERMVRALEQATPAHEPGAYPAYHGLTFGWLVGEIVRRVSGLSFSEFVRRELAEPLGLEGLSIGASPEHERRAATMSRPMRPITNIERFGFAARAIRGVSRVVGFPIDLSYLRDALVPKVGGDVFWHEAVLRTPIPAANGVFTARSLARLYALLGAGGAIDGARLVGEETVTRATEVQTRQRDRVLLFRPNWRLGYHGVFTTGGGVRGAFGHYGFGGSGAWADPKRRLAVAFVNNRAGGTPLGDLRILQIGAAAVRSADRRRGSAA
jgi:CubicO group peptidase (beta-lactamase class C family)